MHTQDGAPSHSTRQLIENLDTIGIARIEWIPFYMNLNLIENVWNSIKNFLQYYFLKID